MTPSSLCTREDGLLARIQIFTCLSLEMRWILMRMCLCQPWASWYLDSETVVHVCSLVPLYHGTCFFVVGWLLYLIIYYTMIYFLTCYWYCQLQSRSESWRSKQRSRWWLRGGISRVLGLEFAKHPADWRWLDRTNGSSTSELRVLLVQYVNREAWHSLFNGRCGLVW